MGNPTVGSLCSGYGGLEMAVGMLWPGATVAWHAETDRWASRVLEARWPDVPNLGDLTAVDWATVDRVDIVTAGFPCQPVSSAGLRRGVTDERWLFDDIAEAIGLLGPRLVLLENVPGLLSANGGHAMARVVGGLAAVGYVGRYGVLAATAVGAPHRRERVFIVAHPSGAGREGPVALGDACGGRPAERPPADTEHVGRDGATTTGGAGTVPHTGRVRQPEGPAPADADSPDLEIYEEACAAWADTLGRPAPPFSIGLERRAEPVNRPAERTGARLNPLFVEWMMGLPAGWVTDLVPRLHAIRVLGNGVVPQQAAAAYAALLHNEEDRWKTPCPG